MHDLAASESPSEGSCRAGPGASIFFPFGAGGLTRRLLAEFPVQFVLGWLRITDPRQRCCTVLGFNPPASSKGRWLLDFLRPVGGPPGTLARLTHCPR